MSVQPTGDFPCRGCGQWHPAYTPCLGQLYGHSHFTPYSPGTPTGPPDLSEFQRSRTEQKLDRIIELLEQIAANTAPLR
jgi:hypothetical protein